MQIRTNGTSRAARVATGLVATLALVFVAGGAMAEAIARQVSGTVEVLSDEAASWSPLAVGATLAPNDRIRTGADGRVEIETEAGTLRVYEDSMLRLPPATEEADRVDLDRGYSLFDVLRRSGRTFEVHTPTVVVSVKGTRFGVDTSEFIGQVAVYRGIVGVRAADASEDVETLVRKGFMATGGPGRAVELDVVPWDDPWARWQDVGDDVARSGDSSADRAEATLDRDWLHSVLNADVLRRAAERRPEVAERILEIQRELVAEALSAVDPEALVEPVEGVLEALPAAPLLPLGDVDPALELMETLRTQAEDLTHEDMLRNALDPQQAEAVQQRLQMEALMERLTSVEQLTGGAPLPTGDSALSSEALEGLASQVLVDVVEARDQVLTEFENAAAGGTTSWTPTELIQEMEQALIDQGYDAGSASTIVNQLTGL